MSCLHLLVFLVFSLSTAGLAPRRRNSVDRKIGVEDDCYEIVRKDGSGFLQNVRPSKQATDPTDKMALEALYHTTAGSLWKNSMGWMKGDPCQDMWYGIKCSEEGRVIEINLFNNGLSGQLPPEIGDLALLQSLRLYNNMITNVPQELFKLRQIQVLDLDFNGIHGNLPAEFISPQLTNLTISCNYFEGFLPSVWITPKLRYLNIYQNLFSGPIPEGLGSAQELVEVELSSNYFSSLLPNKLGSLKKLEKLRLSFNQYQFDQIPDDWSGMENLRHLEMEGVIGGYLPYWIGTSWNHLEVLDLSNGGHLTGFLNDGLCSLSILNTLRLTYNSLQGDIPKCICNLSPLKSLQLGSNKFTGQIPDCLNNLVNLEDLDMSFNELTGTLPLSVAELKKLTDIEFGYNEGLYGEIPSQYSKLAGQLKQLGLSGTHLTSFGDGLSELFKNLPTCYLYDIPFHCPLPSYVTEAHCFVKCSNCCAKYDTCERCVINDGCGWCNEGHALCMEGTATRVNYTLDCSDSNWIYGSRNKCPTKIL